MGVTLNTKTSIVDYLKSQGQDSSYNARKKLADQYGIANYTGTGSQNSQLLKLLKGNASTEAKPSTAQGVSTPSVGTNSNKTSDTQNVSTSATGSTKPSTTQGNKNDWSDIMNFTTPSAYQDAMNLTNQLLEQVSSGRTSYTDQIKDMISQIQNREDFQYDVSKDTLFQQSLASAMASGQTAMQDTIGQASALTGGYGSTYATSAGNQAYNAYIQDAYNNLPEYYQMALEAYNMEGQEMYDQLAMLTDADATEYQRIYDAWGANFTNAQNIYAQDYQKWQDKVSNYWKQQELDQNQSQFVSRYDANGDGKVDSKDNVVESNVEKPSKEQMDGALDAYNKGGEKGLEKYIASLLLSEDAENILLDYALNYGDKPLGDTIIDGVQDGFDWLTDGLGAIFGGKEEEEKEPELPSYEEIFDKYHNPLQTIKPIWKK